MHHGGAYSVLLLQLPLGHIWYISRDPASPVSKDIRVTAVTSTLLSQSYEAEPDRRQA